MHIVTTIPHFVEYFLGLPSLFHDLDTHYQYLFLGGWIYYSVKNLLKLFLVFPVVLIGEGLRYLQNAITDYVLKDFLLLLRMLLFMIKRIVAFLLAVSVIVAMYLVTIKICMVAFTLLTFYPVIGTILLTLLLSFNAKLFFLTLRILADLVSARDVISVTKK